MSTDYTSLTTDQQAEIDAVVTPLCAVLGEFARLMNHAQAVIDTYNSTGSAALTALGSGNTAPNKSGFVGQNGALPNVSQDDTISSISHLESLVGTFNDSTHRQIWVKFCGATNLIG
jgi:hypothetical protein